MHNIIIIRFPIKYNYWDENDFIENLNNHSIYWRNNNKNGVAARRGGPVALYTWRFLKNALLMLLFECFSRSIFCFIYLDRKNTCFKMSKPKFFEDVRSSKEEVSLFSQEPPHHHLLWYFIFLSLNITLIRSLLARSTFTCHNQLTSYIKILIIYWYLLSQAEGTYMLFVVFQWTVKDLEQVDSLQKNTVSKQTSNTVVRKDVVLKPGKIKLHFLIIMAISEIHHTQTLVYIIIIKSLNNNNNNNNKNTTVIVAVVVVGA